MWDALNATKNKSFTEYSHSLQWILYLQIKTTTYYLVKMHLESGSLQ